MVIYNSFLTFRFQILLMAKAGRIAKRIPVNSGITFPLMVFMYIKTVNKIIETNTINTVAIVFLFFKFIINLLKLNKLLVN